MFPTLRFYLRRPCLRFLCLALAAGVFSVPVRAVSMKAGMVIFVSRNAMAESAGTTRSLALRSPIFVGDVIKTDATGSVQILFDDDSVLALAEDGEVTINRFVYSGTGIAVSGSASADSGTGVESVENKSSTSDASGASGSDGGSSDASSASASGGVSGDSSAAVSGSGSGASGASDSSASGSASGTDDSSASPNVIVNTAGGAESSSASTSDNGTSASGSMGNSSASTADGGIGASTISGGATVVDGGVSGGSPGGMAGGANGASGGKFDGAGGVSSVSGSGDGLLVTVSEGTAAFGSGDACRSGCEVVTLAGSAGIGGKDEKLRNLSDRSMGAGVMLTVTASARTGSSTISAVAVAPDMQVTISGAGLATQALARNSMARLGGGMASVSALDAGNLQGQMKKMAAGSAALSPTRLAATTRSMAAADLLSKGAGALNASRGDALGVALATPQAKAVGTANTSASMNVDMTDAFGLSGNTATLTRQTVSSTVDFSGNKLLSYDSVSTVEITGTSPGQIQVDVALKGATRLGANAMENALANGGAVSKTTTSDAGLNNIASGIKQKVDAGKAAQITSGGIARKGK